VTEATADSVRPPDRVLAYARELTDRLADIAGGRLEAAYLHGSSALGGWVPGRSDVDILFIAADGLPEAVAPEMTRLLLEVGGACPGSALECSVVTVTQAAEPVPPWEFVLHVVAGPGEPGRVVRPDGLLRGDRDLIMHYTVCRAAGWAVSGPPPRDLIGPVPRPVVLDYLDDELCWGLEHAPEAYAVLNACRALIYLTDDQIVSKIAGGEAALRRGTGPADIIRRALAQQRGEQPDQPPDDDAVDFVLATATTLQAP
jgi:Domain of unknown function (DUF4111)